jgi:LSU ribosomal protein L20P
MARVKGGVKTRRRHKRVLNLTKGQFGARHKHFRKTNEAAPARWIKLIDTVDLEGGPGTSFCSL